jgi:2-oxoglutarate ferredoxin oxidoreductase subunit gamma
MNEKVIAAGFGGQGVMSLGKLLAYAGMIEEKQVSWLPSYGPEMRGGTANCGVIVSDNFIGSPVVAEDATCLIAMNKPSLDKFEIDVISGGKILINSSLIKEKITRTDVEAFYIDANTIAESCGTVKAANMVMLGAFLELTKTVDQDSILQAFLKVFGENKAKFIPMNREALNKGAEAVK